MKKSIKKTALTTLSILGIFSMMPSALCAPGGEDETPKNLNQVGHIDPFHAMVVGKYLNSVEDLQNLEMVHKKYRTMMEKYRFNPVELESEEVLSFFPSIETCHVEKFGQEKFISGFPKKSFKTLIYFPGSFNYTQFLKILKINGAITEDNQSTGKWRCKPEINCGDPMNGCRITFQKKIGSRKIIFLFDPCSNSTLCDVNSYNMFFKKIGLKEAIIPLTSEFSIPKHVNNIGEYAFSCNINLKEVVNPHSAPSMEDGVYNDLGKLTKIKIPENIKSIGEGAFACCENLTRVEIPNSVTSIGKEAFISCSSLKNLVIPNSVKNIGIQAFDYCTNLTDVDIPNSVTNMGMWAFKNCYNLSRVNIPNSITTIPTGAFYFCGSLTDVDIPNSVTSIEAYAFERCYNLTNIVIPDSVKSIGRKAFKNCVSLIDVRIPRFATSIGEGAFKNCQSLTRVAIPDSVTRIGKDAFWHCPELTEINIPQSLTSIEDNTFRNCVSLRNITIPNSVTSIGACAFYGCKGLEKIKIPTSVMSIGKYAFKYCKNLKHIEFNGEVYDSVDSFMKAFSNYRASQRS